MDKDEKKQEEFTISFKNGALARLKKVATDLNIPDDRLEDVLKKGINLIDMSKEGFIVTIKKGSKEYDVDLRLI